MSGIFLILNKNNENRAVMINLSKLELTNDSLRVRYTLNLG